MGDARHKRIVLLLRTFDMGGAERNAFLLAKGLTQAGYEVELLALLRGGSEVRDLCETEGVNTCQIDVKWTGRGTRWPFAVFRLARELRRVRPDIVLSYTLLPNILGAHAWRFAGAKAFVWRQGDGGVARSNSRLEQAAVKRTSTFIAASTSAAGFLRELGASEEKTSLIYKGVPQHKHDPANRRILRERLDLPPDAMVAGMVANLRPAKDHETLVRAWSSVVTRWPLPSSPPALVLAGRDDGLGMKLRALAFDLGIPHNSLRFVGEVKDVPSVVDSLDLCVFSSKAETEACPYGITECMAAGLPVAAADIEGIRDAVGPHQYEFLAKPFCHDELADRILRLVCDREMRVQLGRQNRERVETEFTIEQMVERTSKLIDELLSSAARRT